jgi:hypothetical protein
MVDTATKQIAPAAGIRFTVASRPQRRFSNVQTVSNLAGPTSFAPIPLFATGHVRKVSLFFNAAVAGASAGAVVAGDAPFNLVNAITLTDATGQPVIQPVSGYNLYLINKYLPAGPGQTNIQSVADDPQMGPEYNYAATATTGVATFRLDLDLEQDVETGYGCIPNLDSNASLQLKIDVAVYSNAFSITGATAATLSVRVSQWYWAPVGASTGGHPNETNPMGYGDYLETRFETQTVSAAAENTIPVNNRGGLVKGIIAISRAAGVRTAFTPGSNVGLVYDNNAIDEGITLEEQYDFLRRQYRYLGADLTTSYAPLTPGVLPGLDRGVMVWNFSIMSGGRDPWLTTRVGTLLQLKATPGAGATQIELLTQLMQVKDAGAFYNRMGGDN